MNNLFSSAETLATIRNEAAGCVRCPLYQVGTQTVFGEGPVPAAVMLVGEQPGDQEDLQGRPFVGPAGKILNSALAATTIERANLYVTNAVKHFKNEPRGKRRIHKKPNTSEIERCKWWLDRELDIVRPQVVVAMGATAARSLTGHPVTIEKVRGRPIAFGAGRSLLVTVHPSLLLRLPNARAKADEMRRFVADLFVVADLVPAIKR